MYARGRIAAGPNALVQRGVKAILGAAARKRTGKTFLAVDFVDGKLGALCLLPVCLLFACFYSLLVWQSGNHWRNSSMLAAC